MFNESIGVRAVFLPGGVVNHFPKNSRKLPKFLRTSREVGEVGHLVRDLEVL